MDTFSNDTDLFASFFENLEVEETSDVPSLNEFDQLDDLHDLDNNTSDPRSKICLPTPIDRVASSLPSHISSSAASTSNALFAHRYDLPTRMDIVSVQTTSVEDHLKTAISIPHDGNNDFVRISTVVNPNPQWILHAYANQHREMEAIVQRLHRLVNETDEQEKRVETEINDFVRKFTSRIWSAMKMENNKKNGLLFIRCLNDLLNEEANKVLEDFKKSLCDKSRSLVEVACVRRRVQYDDQLNKLAETYLEQKLEKSLEKMKCTAYAEFNKQLKSEIIQQEDGTDHDASTVLGKVLYS